MMNLLTRVRCAAAIALVLILGVEPLRAQNDRIIDTPTGWVYLTCPRFMYHSL